MDRHRSTKDKVALFTVSLFLLLTEELLTTKHEGIEGLRKDEGREGEKKGMVSFCCLSPLLYHLDFLFSLSFAPSFFFFFFFLGKKILVRVRKTRWLSLDFSIVEGNPSI